MTRKTSWTNSDSLIVGFGPNSAERNLEAVTNRTGDVKTAKVHITYESTFSNAGAIVAIPAGSAVKNVYIKVTTTWTGGTTLAFGDVGNTAGWILAASFATPTAPVTIQGDGAYAYTATEGQLPPKEYDTATTLYFTATGTYTAGEADLYVEFV